MKQMYFKYFISKCIQIIYMCDRACDNRARGHVIFAYFFTLSSLITRDGPILLFTDISDTSICTEIICRYRYRYYTLKPRQVYYRNFIVVIHS